MLVYSLQYTPDDYNRPIHTRKVYDSNQLEQLVEDYNDEVWEWDKYFIDKFFEKNNINIVFYNYNDVYDYLMEYHPEYEDEYGILEEPVTVEDIENLNLKAGDYEYLYDGHSTGAFAIIACHEFIG